MGFDSKSRYAKQPTLVVRDGRGRAVSVVVPPDAPEQTLLGYHLRRQGERLDHLAMRYLENPHVYWRIAELNEAMHAEMLSEADEIAIPLRGG